LRTLIQNKKIFLA